MSELITIPGKKRETTGKGYARQLRMKGLIPANILHSGKSTPIELDPKWLSKAWKNGKKFNLDLEGTVAQVEIKELQVHPFKRSAIHVDLMYA